MKHANYTYSVYNNGKVLVLYDCGSEDYPKSITNDVDWVLSDCWENWNLLADRTKIKHVIFRDKHGTYNEIRTYPNFATFRHFVLLHTRSKAEAINNVYRLKFR